MDLSYNPMTYLGEDAVSMSKLTHLLLDHMSLQDFSNTAVLPTKSLTHLDLSHNQLRVLQPLAAGSPKLTRINLAGNPIYCSCYLRPLREWALREKVRLGGTCGGPPHLSGENLEAVQPVNLRCQSQEAMLKAELEEQERVTLPTTPPPNKVKCPDDCHCEVREAWLGGRIQAVGFVFVENYERQKKNVLKSSSIMCKIFLNRMTYRAVLHIIVDWKGAFE